MQSLLSPLRNIASRFREIAGVDPDRAVRANPRDVAAWVRLIDACNRSGNLSQSSSALVQSHELHPSGHAVHAFASDIAAKGGDELLKLSDDPTNNVEQAIDVLVKWKTAIQCGHTHDVSKGYFRDAESAMEMQWTRVIFPLIKGMDFTSVLDLACGHGRNTEYLRHLSKEMHLVDINKSCIDACKERFGTEMDGTQFHYHVTDGNHLRMIGDGSISLVYCWDSMVHFDKLIVRDYLSDVARVLKRGGMAFLHHSNLGDKNPDSDWAKNYGTRSDMSATIMRQYAAEVGLSVVAQHLQGRAEGWGQDELDCASILRKERAV